MYKIYKIKDVRLEQAPFPIRSFHLSFYWKLLVGSDRIVKTSDPVRSTAYFPVWKLTLNKTKNKLLNKIRPKIAKFSIFWRLCMCADLINIYQAVLHKGNLRCNSMKSRYCTVKQCISFHIRNKH
jgi:hypothetical protein